MIAANVYHWLTHHGLWNYVIGWTVGAVMTAVVMGIIIHHLVRPTAKYLQKELAHHHKTQDKIVDQLNTQTPGGLGTINNTLLNMQPGPEAS